MLGIVSHELGNALNTIHLSARMLRRFDEATARIDTAAQRIERNARLATRLLDDIRDAAAIEAGRFGLTRSMVRLATVLDETLDALRPQAEAKEITLVAELGTTRSISCDRDRIAQVAANLLGNAIKFTPAGGTVSLGLLEKDGHLVVIVEDTGPGIEEALLQKVFEPFWRGPADESGTGLGLYIARTIVEAHGGTLRAGRCLSGGAVFTVALPIGAAGSSACVMTCAPLRES